MMMREDKGASLRDRATRASPEPQERLGHSASVPSAEGWRGPLPWRGGSRAYANSIAQEQMKEQDSGR